MTDPTRPLAPSLHPAAVYALPDLDALEAVSAGAPGFIYARDGHPNAARLGEQLAALEGGTWGVVTGTGMGALVAAVLGCVSAGDWVVAADRLYGKTATLLHTEFARFGVATTAADATDLDAFRTALAAGPVRAVLVETVSNPLCRLTDIAAVAELAHAAGARLIVDNTFATPALCRPLRLGADLVMESLTKLIGGHSDLTLGVLAGRDPALNVAGLVSTWGLTAGPFDCWLAERSLATLALRASAACATAAAVADWLAVQPGVVAVHYPGRPDHPDHALASRQLTGGFGHMLAFELAGGRDAVNRFLRAAPGVPFAPSLGHFTTTVSYPAGTSHRDLSDADRARQGITPGLVRLSAGCEPPAGVLAELARGLAAAL